MYHIDDTRAGARACRHDSRLLKGHGIVAEQNKTGESGPVEAQKVTRRGFLEWMLGLMGGATALAVAGTALNFMIPGGKESGSKEAVEVIGADEIAVGDGKVVPFNNKPAIIVLTKPDEYVAYSAVCTHAGCVVTWQKDKKRIFCPCHAGMFDIEGNVISGPPPSPLPKYRVVKKGDKILLAES